MKRLVFVIAGVGALALAGCGGSNQDVVDNAEMNQPAPELNELSNEAMDAANAEAAALGNEQSQENAVDDNTANPTDDQEQNVSGM